MYIISNKTTSTSYGHRLKENQHPVRSAKDKSQIGLRVVGWVATGEHKLLYVFALHSSLCVAILWSGWGRATSSGNLFNFLRP